MVRVFTSPACLEHDPGPGHPERPARLAAVLEVLAEEPAIQVVQAEPAPLEAILAVHGRDYLDTVAAMSERGGGDFGSDTPVGAATWRATRSATGASLAALGAALEGVHAFAAVRPPGHHALERSGMGFCLVNHVVVLAQAARAAGRERVLIVDWDVHHGNGTQALVEREPAIRFVSMHQWPWYPGTGAADERGIGNCFNVPLPRNLPRQTYLGALWGGIEAATRDWRPDIILLSAGFDSMLGDPLGGFTLEPADYATVVTRLREAFPRAPIAGLMEGGYSPTRLAAGVLATVRSLQ